MAGLLKWLLAVPLIGEGRLAASGDCCTIYMRDESSRGRQRISALLALLVHGLLLLIVIPSAGRQLTVSQTLTLSSLAHPSGGPPAAEPAQTEPVRISKPANAQKPIPMPLLDIPQALMRSPDKALLEVPQMERQVFDLSIGEVSGPSATGHSGPVGEDAGRRLGRGDDGDAVHQPGVGGVSPPVPLVQTLPAYTDAAIRARIQGTVLLRAVVRRDGSVDRIQVLRGLGYGLDEKAIQEIANRWKFRPGLRNGQPVDVRATIEVSFALR